MDKENLIEKFLLEITNQWFVYLIISFILFLVAWRINVPVTFKVIALLILSTTYTLYTLKVRRSWTNIFNTVLTWLSFIIYLAASVKDANVALIGIVVMIILIIGESLITALLGLYNSEKIPTLIVAYLMLAFMVILSFSVFYITTSVSEGNSIKNSFSNTTITNTYDYLYFSSTTYYSSGYGEYYPVGDRMRSITQIEVAFSFVIHIIVLGMVISRLGNKYNKAPI